MLKKSFFGRLKYLLLIVFLLIPVCVTTLWGAAKVSERTEQPGADLLKMELKSGADGSEAASKSKMSPVWFPHDAHTENIDDKDCTACHRKKDDRFVFSFKNAKELDMASAMEMYHDQCTACHNEVKAEGRKTGPMMGNCRECHRETPEDKPESEAWQPIDFDKSLHYRHAESKDIKFRPEVYDNNCGACHHVYDEKQEKTVYKKGEEGSCQYCHKEEVSDDTQAWKTAAHTSCLNCHLSLHEKEKDAGPVECAGCHSQTGQAKIDKLKEVPRLDWKQPDEVLMAPWLEEADKLTELPDQLTHPVAFNHKNHEASTESCRQCHHESLESCSECHTSKATEDGGFVSRMTAMHGGDPGKSCTGCHESMKQNQDCAGCHSAMGTESFGQFECRQCHDVEPEQLKPLPPEEDANKKLARKVIAKRNTDVQTVADKDIPEKVKIDILADEYKASEFPHRKIVRALEEKTKGSRLATYFHETPETLCMGCHHNSPASLNPPACVSCHQIGGPTTESDRPHLKGAYHGQCIGCHEQMNMEKPAATDCKACHEPRSDKQIDITRPEVEG